VFSQRGKQEKELVAFTLEKVARLASVSRSTVSRVINHHPNVRPKTRERVWQVIRESGYQPNVVARSLVTNRTRTISVVIPEVVTTLFTDPFFPLLLRGATETCNAHHYQLMLSLFTASDDRKEMYKRVLCSGFPDGAIVASTSLSDPLITDMLQDQISFVSVGRHPDKRVHYVDVDNVGGARMVVEHLIRLGHRRIATVTGPPDMVVGQDRLSGYRQALEAHHIPIDEELIVEGDFTESSGVSAIQKLLPISPTAIFAASDTMAIGILKGLREVGLRVPQDVALVGFDDIPITSMIEPALTTVRQPIERLGSLAVEVLLSVLKDSPEAKSSVHRTVLPTELVIRNSCSATC
jgi:LacI family transcriptional regulator